MRARYRGRGEVVEWAFGLEKEKMTSAISQNVAVLRQWTGLGCFAQSGRGRERCHTVTGRDGT